MTTPTAIGIDLGTTNSLAAFVRNGRPVVVRDAGGAALVPSCISFHPDGTVLVGTAARDRALTDPEHTVFSVKRLMGRTLKDLEAELKLIPHQIVERDAGDGRRVLRVRIGDREHTPEELSALILKEVRKRAGNPTKAVITVPAYFDDAQRQATRDAGRIAGLDVLRIVNEPTAAALAYGLDKANAGVVAVYDLGGGTFDCSILRLADGVFKVLSTNGDTYLGGDDFDRAIMRVVATEMNVELDGNRDVGLLQHLRDAAEKTKIALSEAESAEFVIRSGPARFGNEDSPPQAGPHPVASQPPSPSETVNSVDGGRGLQTDNRVPPSVLDSPLPPSSRRTVSEGEGPGVRAESHPVQPVSFRRTVTRTELEALLAPFIDRSLAKCKAALRDADLTAADIDEVVLVGGSTRIPYVRRRVEAFFGRIPHADLNPDEVVALGAAVQADILTSGRRDRLLLDVVPLSLGIETLGGVVDKIIDRNSTIPCRATTRYTTYVDNQTAIILNIYQGERELIQDCRLLGMFKLGGIPPMPAQFAQVDVSFLVDANGQLTVSAVEKRSGVTATVEVKAGHGLSPDEVERMVLESVEHAHADFTTRRLIELRNKADADLRHTVKALAEAGDHLTADQRAAIDVMSGELRGAMAGTDVDALQRIAAAFGKATLPLAEVLMNAVAKKALDGKTETDLDAGKL